MREIHGDSSTTSDRMQVEIVDDNVKHNHSKSHHEMPRLPHQSLVTMRRMSSTRQLSRWSTTFQPRRVSAPELTCYSPQRNMLERGKINTLPKPKRILSPVWQPRSQETCHSRGKVTRADISSMDNATWSDNDVRVLSERSHRISELFRLSNLKLSPEQEEAKVLQIHGEPKKSLTEGTKEYLLVDEDALKQNQDIEVLVKEAFLRRRELRLARSVSLDDAPIIPRRWDERKKELEKYSSQRTAHQDM